MTICEWYTEKVLKLHESWKKVSWSQELVERGGHSAVRRSVRLRTYVARSRSMAVSEGVWRRSSADGHVQGATLVHHNTSALKRNLKMLLACKLCMTPSQRGKRPAH